MTLRKRSCPAVSQIWKADGNGGVSHDLQPRGLRDPPSTKTNTEGNGTVQAQEAPSAFYF